ncbi:hypothetical protein M011DRAFT_469714 [Sporormia fimetaria CBS 119925]|uniref:Uncharacterized protein n=1 Tax=Sporormia fimetaria CBS 119925 TaxID=1340428 RepID=A0A6A6V5I9_9PLEO|nr:hypothetical protein M011DRAFT_469714 [Sporormia fimetaria CBS 119925]
MAERITNRRIVEQRASQDDRCGGGTRLTRQLYRPSPPPRDDDRYNTELTALERPQTAPSPGVARTLYHTALDPPLMRPLNKPPPRPPRPDSSVIRDVNAWLETSMSRPAPPLMQGLDYWREGPYVGTGLTSDVRYAIPIVQTTETEPTPSHGLQLKSFCRRARKLQVRMPSLIRCKAQRSAVTQRNQAPRRSTSTPLLPKMPELSHVSIERSLSRSISALDLKETASSVSRTSQRPGWLRTGRPQPIVQVDRMDKRAGTRFDDAESSMERRVNAVLGQTPRLPDPMMAAKRSVREDSVGELSDAPTYFTGLPPPSYRSRAASTTSSFGCVDAMSISRQEMSPAELRSSGVRDRFRKFARKAHISK